MITADPFGGKGRRWLAGQQLPADEQTAVAALLRKLDFHTEKPRLIDGSSGGSRGTPATQRAAVESGSVGQQRRESLHPPVGFDVVDLDTTFDQQFLDVVVGEVEP